ncbi:cytochrome bd-I oxidase subunit CydH [Gilliamella apicola]|uniref:YnhF family membrane protein n=1 Tax=Gilliamella apicola TaxID=1196095 RepID=A0A2V4EMC2_9GAMM|nr:YnhF family membrane protein [Gilliamella apicola]PXZ05698.1 YnhF family membrane protein [Gilliamella apicola]
MCTNLKYALAITALVLTVIGVFGAIVYMN